MDNENKREGRTGIQADAAPTVDSTNRARNRTVMLTPEMTGQVRARLGGDFEPPPQALPHHRHDRQDAPNSGWEDAQRVQLQQRGSAQEVDRQPPLEEEEAEWARPIEPAMISEGPVSNGTSYPPSSDEPAPAWSQSPQLEPEPREFQAPRVVRQQTEPSYSPPPQQQQPDLGNQRGAYDRPNPNQYIAETPVRENGVHATGRPEEVFWKNMTPLVGFLVTFDNDPLGSYIELRSGRLIVTSEREASGNCLLITDPSVSPMHAIMRVSNGSTIQILDQLSENGTRIRRPGIDEEELLSGEKSVLSHGDVVMFGERKFHVCLLNVAGV